jgi:hypothetical protein
MPPWAALEGPTQLVRLTLQSDMPYMRSETPLWDEICEWNMQRRVAYAGSDYASPEGLLVLTEWVLGDLERSMLAFDTFSDWKPGIPEGKDADILTALVSNPVLPGAAAKMIVNSGWWRLRPKVLSHRAVTIDDLGAALADLVDTASTHIWMGASFSAAVEQWCLATTSHRDYSAELWDPVIEAAAGIPRLLAIVAEREDITPEQCRMLLSLQNEAVIRRIANNPHVPSDLRVLAVLMSN